MRPREGRENNQQNVPTLNPKRPVGPHLMRPKRERENIPHLPKKDQPNAMKHLPAAAQE